MKIPPSPPSKAASFAAWALLLGYLLMMWLAAAAVGP